MVSNIDNIVGEHLEGKRDKFAGKYDIWSGDELPENLNNRAWAGNLFNLVVSKYKMLVGIYSFFVLLVGAGVSVGMYFLQSNWDGLTQNPFPYWTLGMIVALWSPIGIPALYALFLTKSAFIIRLGEENEFYLDPNRWFKKDYSHFNLNEGKYDSGYNRYLWMWEYEKGKFRTFSWDDVVVAKTNIGKTPPNAADMAGIIAYKETMSKYAAKKVITSQQIIQYSAFAIILAIEVAAVLFFQGRLADSP